MWGNLAQVMAQGLQGKRAGEAQRYERDQDLLATLEGQAQRAREQERYKAQQTRLDDRDRRDAERDRLITPLEAAMLQARIANEQAPPPPVQRPWEKAGFDNPDDFYQHERRLAGSRRDPAARSGSAPLDVAAEDKRRMALISRGNNAIGQLPRDQFGQTLDPEMARRMGEITDSIASEIGAPAPAVRGNPFGGLRMPAEGGGVPGTQPPPPPPEGPLDATTVSTLQRELRGARLSGPAAVQFLREEGFNDAEIAQIVGRGGG